VVNIGATSMPVNATAGTLVMDGSSRSFAAVDNPSISGIEISETTRSTFLRRAISSASAPQALT